MKKDQNTPDFTAKILEMENNNIEVGIWTIDKNGVKGSPENFPEVHLDNLQLWGTTKRGDLILWDLPVQFAEKEWCDEEQAVYLIQAMAIARGNQNAYNPGEFPVDIDEHTIRVMMEIIDNRTEPNEAVWESVWAKRQNHIITKM